MTVAEIPTPTVARRKARAFASLLPVRVYASLTDRSGVTLCADHRFVFFATYPEGSSNGYRGETCEWCQP